MSIGFFKKIKKNFKFLKKSSQKAPEDVQNNQSSLKIEQQDNLTFWIRKIKETPKDSFEFFKN